MRLDSLAYRFIWRLGRLLRLYSGPPPIYWRKKSLQHNLHPPAEVWSRLDADEVENLRSFQREVEVLVRIYPNLPAQFTYKQWLEVARMSSRRERFDMFRFAKLVERKKANDVLHKQERRAAIKASTNETNEAGISQEWNSFFFHTHPEYIKSHERHLTSMRMIRALQLHERPTIAIDCRFLAQHTKRGRSLTFLQLQFLLSANRKRADPWPIVLVNLDISNPVVKQGIDAYLALLTADSQFVSDYTQRSYLDLFERQNLIYLSPHAEEKLTTEEVMDERNTFIIGAIVDRIKEPGIHPEASAIYAQEDRVRCRRFPLDDHITWRAGNRFLTLTGVTAILQNVYDTRGDWNTALKAVIPVRKTSTMNERNPKIKQSSDDRRRYWSEIWRILNESLEK